MKELSVFKEYRDVWDGRSIETKGRVESMK